MRDVAHLRQWWWKQLWAAIATKHGPFHSSKAEVWVRIESPEFPSVLPFFEKQIMLKSISKELGDMIPRQRDTDKDHVGTNTHTTMGMIQLGDDLDDLMS